jgi:hypothetical protein
MEPFIQDFTTIRLSFFAIQVMIAPISDMLKFLMII